MVQKVQFKRLDIQIQYSCNLSCKGCIYFVDNNRQGTVEISEAEEWLKQWSQKIDVFQEIALSGGEPLLNDDILEYIEKVRLYFPNTRIKINTNIFYLKPIHVEKMLEIGNSVIDATFNFRGNNNFKELKNILIDSIKPHGPWKPIRDEFGKAINWKLHNDKGNTCIIACKKDDVYIRCMIYGNIWKFPAKGEGINLRPWNSLNYENSIKLCATPTSSIMYKGRLYKCAPTANLKDTLQFFNIDKVPEWQEYIKYNGCGLDDDIQAFADNIGQPHQICKMCCDNTENLKVIDHFSHGAVEIN